MLKFGMYQILLGFLFKLEYLSCLHMVLISNSLIVTSLRQNGRNLSGWAMDGFCGEDWVLLLHLLA